MLGGVLHFLPFPLLYFVPRATFSTSCGALSFRKLFSAITNVFQTKQVAFTSDLKRLEAAVRSRTRENGLKDPPPGRTSTTH
jgi:hypothetical protein